MGLLKRWNWVLVLLLGTGLGWTVAQLPRGPLLPLQDAVVAGVGQDTYRVEQHPEAGGYLEVRPTGPVSRLLVFYPGGLVRPQAYVWLGVALSPLGVRTVIPTFPLDLAVFDKNRASTLLQHLNPEVPVVLAGHSLGGAMAASFLKAHPEDVAALVLLAAYPAASDDLSSLSLPVLTLAAEKDGLTTLADVEGSLKRLPSGTEKQVLPGAVHAFFGRYGPQKGDGIPTVPREVTEAQVVAAFQRFLSKLP